MSHHNRKRTRTNNRASNNSFTSLASQSSEEETANTSTAPQTQSAINEKFHKRIDKAVDEILEAYNEALPLNLNIPKNEHTIGIFNCFLTMVDLLHDVVKNVPGLAQSEIIVKLVDLIRNTNRSDNRVDAAVSTEPPPAPPTYNSVACMADTAPTPSAQPLNPSPSPKPGPRPPKSPHTPNKVHPLTSRPRSHQVRPNVRLVACIAGRADALTSATPHWKEVPTDCFSSLSKDLKAAAPGSSIDKKIEQYMKYGTYMN
ncbi:hypothetical protein FRC11_010412 [Ceratobasidium sp. 423]|nr:hypothetical protein FRC11_010412 [Ceratobasidium sp. 423]